jgi:hypothetical protein
VKTALEAVIAAFDRANLVALGERHWTREDSQFRLDLLRHPAFARAANDIVVEFGNPLYQPILDRFMSGDSVPAGELQRVWRDTTQPGAWDSPVYEEFLSTVRAVNLELAPDRRLRVLAADYPIDWSRVSSAADLDGPIHDRDRFAAKVIRDEVLDRSRKALMVFGAAHLYRNRPGTVVELLKEDSRARWFIVVPVGGRGMPAEIMAKAGTAAAPVLHSLGGCVMGRLRAADLLERGTQRIRVVEGKPVFEGGKPVFIPVFERDVKAGDLADACLSFGEEEPESVPPPRALCEEAGYGKEVARRLSIIKLAM